jgi:thiol-disulfide isomerase/thioredoxin
MAVTSITSIAQFREIVNADKSSVFAIGSDGCPGCVAMEPTFAEHAEKNTDMVFYKINLSMPGLQEVGRELRVHAVRLSY